MIEEKLYDYICEAPKLELPEDVDLRCRMHLLDTLVAIISGITLLPGRQAHNTVLAMRGKGDCSLLGTSKKVSAFEAALANGMAAHADETDDSHLEGRFHPGCAIIPAAISAAEIGNVSSQGLLRSIALGYDIGARCNMALGVRDASKIKFSTHCVGGLFGAAAAASACFNLQREQINTMMSFTVQQASGLPYWNRDPDHIEKAFVFGGKGARDGLYSAFFGRMHLTSPQNPLTGERGFLPCFAEQPDASKLIDGLGEIFEISNASIKKWCVGSPIQSVLDALEALSKKQEITIETIEKITLTMPSDRIHIVDDASIPTICLQHLVALMVLRGDCTFADAHDEKLMSHPAILEIRNKIDIVKSDELARAKPERQSIVALRLKNDKEFYHHAKVVHGTPQRPMTIDDVAKKATSVLGSVSDQDFSRLIDICLGKNFFSMTELVESCCLVN